MKFNIKNKIRILLLIIFIFHIKNSLSFPPIAAEFHGIVKIDDKDAPIGTKISIFDSNNVMCGTFIVKKVGYYGFLSCNGNDPDTSVDEGALQNEKLKFYVNGIAVELNKGIKWSPGSFQNVSLYINSSKPVIEKPQEVVNKENSLFYYIIFSFTILVLFLTAKIITHKRK